MIRLERVSNDVTIKCPVPESKISPVILHGGMVVYSVLFKIVTCHLYNDFVRMKVQMYEKKLEKVVYNVQWSLSWHFLDLPQLPRGFEILTIIHVHRESHPTVRIIVTQIISALDLTSIYFMIMIRRLISTQWLVSTIFHEFEYSMSHLALLFHD